ncbi:SDR family NAD(P)-dependent oxidoreductase [Herbiconiux sp. SYSU D00978]|uniref:SDR family NAD(P)-dependent oxidoreductase n=1 Tax=Herbiconiux sp. SYSU D00978 TaxID=2812562 RepID=UPI0027DC2D36|nr:SDR family oxidoreductase [Herbiconiux sp. SYSU D00978]
MPARLEGKTVLVTGAATGIGRAIADRFVSEGARVAYADRDADGAGAAAAHDRALAVGMDISDERSVEAGYAAVAAAGWELDVVVANAGIQLFGQDAKIADLDLSTWQRTIDVNLTGTFLTVKHGVRALRRHGRGGSVIFTGSPTALNGEGNEFTAYSSSKAGMHGMARAVAGAYAAENIRANVVVPGYTETTLVAAIADDPASRAAIVSRIPLGRAGSTRDVEGVMVFLASDDGAFATGAEFRVDGGMTTL